MKWTSNGQHEWMSHDGNWKLVRDGKASGWTGQKHTWRPMRWDAVNYQWVGTPEIQGLFYSLAKAKAAVAAVAS